MGLQDDMDNAGVAARLKLDEMKAQEEADREAAKAAEKEKALRDQAEAAKQADDPGNIL